MEIEVKVKSSQFSKETGHSNQEFSCTGKLEQKGEKYYLRYREPENPDEAPADVTLKVDGEAVTLMRSGEAHSHFVFVKGQRDTSKYITPYGGFLMSIMPKVVKISRTDTGGEISLGYSLCINNDTTTENNFCITYNLK